VNTARPQVVSLGINPRKRVEVPVAQIFSRRVRATPAFELAAAKHSLSLPTQEEIDLYPSDFIFSVEIIFRRRRLFYIRGLNSRTVLKSREIEVTKDQFDLLDGLPISKS